MTIAAQRMRRTLQVDRVPQHDGRRHQVEAAGPVALLLEAPIPDFPKDWFSEGLVACGLPLPGS